MDQSRSSWTRALGPAFITASVVLGPGSIVTASKVGASFGFSMVWLLVVTAALMIGMTALSARLGVALSGTLCEEVARRAGRPLAALIGLAVFAIVACFQFGNNMGIYTALAGLMPASEGDATSINWPLLVVCAINLGLLCFLFGFRQLYAWIERVMMVLVAIMLLAFAANLVFLLVKSGDAARNDSVADAASANSPEAEPAAPRLTSEMLPSIRTQPDGQRTLFDAWAPLIGLMGTTFSVAGAFFQSYLVRQKGWNQTQVREGLIDTVAGIGVLALITLVIMSTSAIALRGQTIQDAAQLSNQLQLFGPSAKVLFSLGLLAAALSSLLVNAAIGGSMLSDGLGLGGLLSQWWPKFFTAAALLVGLAVAVLVMVQKDFNTVSLIVTAQALTVIAWPLLAGVLIWLALRARAEGSLSAALRPPMWMWTLCSLGLLLALLLAPRMAYVLYLKMSL